MFLEFVKELLPFDVTYLSLSLPFFVSSSRPSPSVAGENRTQSSSLLSPYKRHIRIPSFFFPTTARSARASECDLLTFAPYVPLSLRPTKGPPLISAKYAVSLCPPGLEVGGLAFSVVPFDSIVPSRSLGFSFFRRRALDSFPELSGVVCRSLRGALAR